MSQRFLSLSAPHQFNEVILCHFSSTEIESINRQRIYTSNCNTPDVVENNVAKRENPGPTATIFGKKLPVP